MDGQFSLFEDPIEPETSKDLMVYRSSAGSGKTFALVKEYLKIVLRDPLAYKHILAITFTNKATDEMKQRIIDELTDLSQGNATDIQREISKDFNHYKPPVPIQLRATKALRNILHDYSRFEVSTIDHFFSQLVRLLARELKLNFNYEIDVDVDQTIQEALDRLYLGLHQNPQWRQWMEEYAYSQLDDDKGWQLDQKIMQLGKELFKERFHQSFSQIKKEEVNLETIKVLIDQLKETQAAFVSTLKSYAAKALELIQQHGLLVRDFKGGSRSVANTFNKIVLKGDMELTKTFVKVALGEDDWFAKTSLKKEEIKAVAKGGLDRISRELYQYHEKFYSNYVTASELLRNIYAYGLLEALYEKWQEYQKEENLILISQNSFLLKSVIEDKDAPFLYEKIGSRFHHLLIDEFQDTSVYQWENLKPLVTHTLDEEYQKVLLVGDIKQSIYRWRGGDKNLLLHKVQQDLNLYAAKWKEEGLNDNWRSLKNVVGFNNMFFQTAIKVLQLTKELPSGQPTLEQVYREVVQNAKGGEGGFVEVQFFEGGEAEETYWEAQALERTRSIIHNSLENGAKYQDILILVEKNEHANQISSQLTTLNIPVISDQALKLSQ
ncbi:MAG: UvrD-helicase domain-containing protein, partial [Cyclobacteriaceae bacterium]